METLCACFVRLCFQHHPCSLKLSQDLYFVNTLLRGCSSQENGGGGGGRGREYIFFSLVKIAKMVFSADCDSTNENNEKSCKRATLA